MRKIVPEGAYLPFGYGIAYRDYCSYSKICYPIPINWLIFLARCLYHEVIAPPPQWWERQIRVQLQIPEVRPGFLVAASLTIVALTIL